MKLDQRINLGMTIAEVKAILGEPVTYSVQNNPIIYVYGRYHPDSGDYLEMTFYAEKSKGKKGPPGQRKLIMVQQHPEHETLLPVPTPEERAWLQKWRDEWKRDYPEDFGESEPTMTIKFSETEPTSMDCKDGIYDRRDCRVLPDGRNVRKWTDGKWRAWSDKNPCGVEYINVIEDQGQVKTPDLVLLDRKTA